ncbi:MAG: hypothetical protein ACE5IO_10775 [Thermoplasmata archaeon]
MAQFVKRIFALRSGDFQLDDINSWLIDLFDDLYGLELHPGTAKELRLREGWARAGMLIEEPVLIEARASLRDELDDAHVQIEKHLKATADLNIGVATDGVLWRFFIVSGDSIHEYHDFQVGRNWTDLELSERILGAVPPMRYGEPKPVIPGDLVDVFKRGSPIYQICSNLLRSIAQTSESFNSQLDAWTAEYRNVYPNFDELCKGMGTGNAEVGAKELHFRYAYYVLVIKMIAQVFVLGESLFVEEMKGRPKGFVVGRPLLEAGVRIVEVDVNYSWIASGAIDDLNLLLREISNMLLRYDLSAVNEDVFRLMYEEILGKDALLGLGRVRAPM